MGHVLAVLPQFALASLVLAVLPGPATALFLHRTIRDGRGAGLAAVAGSEVAVFGWGRSPRAAFGASVVSTFANPKAAVFAFSFFPQFLPEHGPVLATTVALAAIQVVIDAAYCTAVVLLASRVRHWLARAAVRRRLERMLGTVLIALGIQLAAETR